jgi:hypothetical protein
MFPPFMEPEPTRHIHKIQQPMNTDLSHMDPARIPQRVTRSPFFPGQGLFLGVVFSVRALKQKRIICFLNSLRSCLNPSLITYCFRKAANLRTFTFGLPVSDITIWLTQTFRRLPQSLQVMLVRYFFLRPFQVIIYPLSNHSTLHSPAS